jgi:endonuclease/exonuclease/phosphatase (EEP) superfamily protein YafD
LPHLVGWPLLAAGTLVRGEPRRLPWQLELLDTWLLYLVAPFPGLAAIGLARGQRALAGLGVLGSLLTLATLRTTLGRGRRPACLSGRVVRVLTANVLAKNTSADGLAEMVRRERPDLVLLQEVRHEYARQAVSLLSELLPHRLVSPHFRHGGAALFSRWPLDGAAAFRLCEPRGHLTQRVRLCIDGQPLTVFNVHADTPFEIRPRFSGFPPFKIRHRVGTNRDQEIDRLLELTGRADGAVLVAGDFNAQAGSLPHRRLLQGLRDAFLEVGRGLGNTFPRRVSVHGLILPVPLLRIDYVLCRGPIEPLTCRPLEHEGSDHRAVLAELALAVPD